MKHFRYFPLRSKARQTAVNIEHDPHRCKRPTTFVAIAENCHFGILRQDQDLWGKSYLWGKAHSVITWRILIKWIATFLDINDINDIIDIMASLVIRDFGEAIK